MSTIRQMDRCCNNCVSCSARIPCYCFGFLLSGNYNGSTFYNGGVNGNYWSATGGSTTSNARNLNFNTGNVNSANNNNRRNGFSVRCILGS